MEGQGMLKRLLGKPKTDVGAYGVTFHLVEAFLLLASPEGLIRLRRFRTNAAPPIRESLNAALVHAGRHAPPVRRETSAA